MTTADRLKQLSGLAGVSAAAMLLTLGTGATAGQILVDYSQLPSATAAQHILVDHGGGVIRYGASSFNSTGVLSADGVLWKYASSALHGYGTLQAVASGANTYTGEAVLAANSFLTAIPFGAYTPITGPMVHVRTVDEMVIGYTSQNTATTRYASNKALVVTRKDVR